MNGDEEVKNMRKRIFLWVAIAFRPITVAEMQYACVTEDYEESFDPEEKILPSKEEMLEACGSLIEVFNYDDPRLRFTHLSVKEFLLQPAPTLLEQGVQVASYLGDAQKAQASMAITCCK